MDDSSNLQPTPAKSGFDGTKLILPISILVAAVLISGSILVSQGVINLGGKNTGQPEGKVKVSADDDPVLGSKKAKVEIIEFSDFQCPFCRSFWSDTLPQLKKEYIDTGKAKLVYRDFPLSFHAMAKPAAYAANCAAEQGKYWEMHDKLFEKQNLLGNGTVQFTSADILAWSGELGLDRAAFSQCFSSDKYQSEVDKDAADGTMVGVEGTPTFFINGRRLVGALPFEQFKKLIDEEL